MKINVCLCSTILILLLSCISIQANHFTYSTVNERNSVLQTESFSKSKQPSGTIWNDPYSTKKEYHSDYQNDLNSLRNRTLNYRGDLILFGAQYDSPFFDDDTESTNSLSLRISPEGPPIQGVALADDLFILLLLSVLYFLFRFRIKLYSNNTSHEKK